MFLYYMAPFHSFPVCSVFLHIARSGKGFTWNCCFSLYRIDSTSCLLTLWLTRKVSALSLSIIHYKWNRSKLVAIFEILTSQTRIFYSSVHCCFFFFLGHHSTSDYVSHYRFYCISQKIGLKRKLTSRTESLYVMRNWERITIFWVNFATELEETEEFLRRKYS